MQSEPVALRPNMSGPSSVGKHEALEAFSVAVAGATDLASQPQCPDGTGLFMGKVHLTLDFGVCHALDVDICHDAVRTTDDCSIGVVYNNKAGTGSVSDHADHSVPSLSAAFGLFGTHLHEGRIDNLAAGAIFNHDASSKTGVPSAAAPPNDCKDVEDSSIGADVGLDTPWLLSVLHVFLLGIGMVCVIHLHRSVFGRLGKVSARKLAVVPSMSRFVYRIQSQRLVIMILFFSTLCSGVDPLVASTDMSTTADLKDSTGGADILPDLAISDIPQGGLRAKMRGSALSFLSGGTSLDLSTSNDVVSQLQRLDQARLNIDQNLNEMNVLLRGDSSVLSSLAVSIGAQEQDLRNVVEYMRDHQGLSELIGGLNSMVQDELHPMLVDVYQMILEKAPESQRQLKSIFDHYTAEDDRGGFRGSHDSFSSGSSANDEDTPSFSAGNGYASSLKNPKRMKKLIKDMLSKNMVEDPNMSSFYGAMFGTRHRHRGRTRRGGKSIKRRLQTSNLIDTCDERCNQDSDVERKKCNCAELIECVKKLRVTDLAVIFSKGLVDSDTGTIDVFVDEYDSNKRTIERKKNPALEDLFDADHLLEKEDKIKSLAGQGIGTCDELLDQFHIPCSASENSCSDSNERSYRLVSEACNP